MAEEGYDPDFGARPLRRVLQSYVEDPLSEGLLSGEFYPHDDLEAGLVDGEIIINVINRPEPEPEEHEPEAVVQ